METNKKQIKCSFMEVQNLSSLLCIDTYFRLASFSFYEKYSLKFLCGMGLMVINSFIILKNSLFPLFIEIKFFLVKNSVLTDLCLSRTSKMLFYSLSCCHPCFGSSVHNMSFSPTAYKDFSSPLVLRNLFMMCLGIVFFMFLLFGDHCREHWLSVGLWFLSNLEKF